MKQQIKTYAGAVCGNPHAQRYNTEKYRLITDIIKPICKFDTIENYGLRKHLEFNTTLKAIREDLKDFRSQLNDNLPRAKRKYGKTLINDLIKLEL